VLQILVALVVVFEGRPGLLSNRLIVGHAACGRSSFILTQAELVEVPFPTWPPAQPSAVQPIVHPLRRLAAGDKLWGLACLADGSLWTLAAPHTVARIGRDGALGERVDVLLPRTLLFGAGEELVVQQMPIVAGAPVLMTTPARRPERVRPWPGLIARDAGDRERLITRNLVSCGLALGGWLPCWFPEESWFAVSDGSTSRSIAWPQLNAPGLDRSAPIWDVALTAEHRYWLVATGASQGRRAGGRLYRAREGGSETEFLDLVPAVRIIVSAGPSRCLLLSVAGTLVEVMAR
jgi:hypothetical protein